MSDVANTNVPKNKRFYILKYVKSKLRISEVISRYSSLINKGNNKYVCLCPLHKEKTPSCHINDDLGVFYCFGCKQGGTVIDFLKLAEGVTIDDLPDFVRKNYGITFSDISLTETRDTLEQFFYTLKNNMSEEDKEFLKEFVKNKIGDQYESAINLADLIFVSLEGAKNAIEILTEKEIEELSALGVIVHNQSSSTTTSIYTPFANRIVVPIKHFGKIVGISGRYYKFDKETKNSKYFHSRFPKKDFLLFYDEARRIATKNNMDYVFVTEGMFDALSLLSINIPAVSILGSSVSTEQLNLLNRCFKTVNFVFDSDEAGLKSKYNTAKTLIETNRPSFSSYFVTLPKDTDIDELIKELKENYKEKLKVKSVYDVYIDYHILISRNAVINVNDISSVKRETLNRLIPNFVNYKNNEHMYYVMQRFAERAGYNLEKIIEITDIAIKTSNYNSYSIAKNNEFTFIPAIDRKIISSIVYMKENEIKLPVNLIKQYANTKDQFIRNLIFDIINSEDTQNINHYNYLVEIVNYANICKTPEELENLLQQQTITKNNPLLKISNFLEQQTKKIKSHARIEDKGVEDNGEQSDDTTNRFVF